MDAEVVFASAYAGFLVVIAAALETIARYTHRRAQASSTQGFTFVPEGDLWRCPNGQHLHRESYDETFRIARYRAQPHHCNNCNIKSRCTDSDAGRVLEHQAETWLQSGMRRFHRGMSLTLLVLAATILGIEVVRQHQRTEEIVLAGFLLCLGIVGIRIASSLRSVS